ncbi:hypothetical protein EI94DRAFT_1731555 [Lactarius quietus]|nr:hypothetical protein EI94DRAFT_1731555 [Lactarius quietus]
MQSMVTRREIRLVVCLQVSLLGSLRGSATRRQGRGPAGSTGNCGSGKVDDR